MNGNIDLLFLTFADLKKFKHAFKMSLWEL